MSQNGKKEQPSGMDIGKYVDAIAGCVREKAHPVHNDQGELVELVVSFTLDRAKIAQVLIQACEERVRTDPRLQSRSDGGIILP